MNFLLRSATLVGPEQPSANDTVANATSGTKAPTTLEGLVSVDPFPRYDGPENSNREVDGDKGLDGSIAGPSSRNDASCINEHSDVSEQQGWITISCRELPEDWVDAPDIHSLRALDRNFVFPGEQVHIAACLSMYELETEIITPFKVAAVMSKNGIGRNGEKEMEGGNSGDGVDSVSGTAEVHQDKNNIQNEDSPSKGKTDVREDISTGESLLRKQDQERKIATELQRLENSHFFVRIAESGEMLWSKKDVSQKSSESSDASDKISAVNWVRNAAKEISGINTVVDKGGFNANISGGVARNIGRCYSLANGDLVVLLQISVGVDLLKDPEIEILQFEKHQTKGSFSEKHEGALHTNKDPCGGLLAWLLPLENSLPPPARTVSPPAFGSPSGMGSTPLRPNLLTSSGSQIFSFGHLRSYSMSAISQSSIPPPAVTAHNSKLSFDYDDRDLFSKQKPVVSQKTRKEELLSFRTVSLEPERFSVRCGLEGVYIPGRRWRRKLEIIQPIEIQSFAADCNSDDLLCVQIKNISPAHIPDLVIYIDAITIVLEEPGRGGLPLSFPIASVEPGEDYSLPNLALRKGEEHSFIVKPAISAWKKLNSEDRRSPHSSSQRQTKKSSNLHHHSSSSKIVEEKSSSAPADHYAVMVSCRCNYTESRLFFKQPTSWQPRVSRDILISVASETSRDVPRPDDDVASQLPVQVLTLQAANLTSEDLTMTILAPASFTAPPTVVSLSTTPKTPINPFFGLTEGTSSSIVPLVTENQKRYSPFEQGSPVSGDILSSNVACTHLWLQSRVPLGCVPSQMTATIKLELLPLTDGIITLDTLQIDVKEKGCSYIPEHSLKINATSSISSGII